MSRFSTLAGTAGTATVPSGCVVTSVRAHASSAASLVITLADGTVLPSVTLPADPSWFRLDFIDSLRELCAGSSLAFSGTDSYVVALRDLGGG
jgi:hypothetical protein